RSNKRMSRRSPLKATSRKIKPRKQVLVKARRRAKPGRKVLWSRHWLAISSNGGLVEPWTIIERPPRKTTKKHFTGCPKKRTKHFNQHSGAIRWLRAWHPEASSPRSNR